MELVQFQIDRVAHDQEYVKDIQVYLILRDHTNLIESKPSRRKNSFCKKYLALQIKILKDENLKVAYFGYKCT